MTMPDPHRSPDPGAQVVVVGSGLSGLAVANGLVDAGVRDVLVLEAGPAQRGPDASAAQGTAPRWTTAAPPHYAAPGADSPESATPGLGGRSLYWHGVLLPIERYALDDPRWPAPVGDALDGRAAGDGLYANTVAAIDRWAREPGFRPVSGDAADSAFVDWLASANAGAAGRPTPVPQAVRLDDAGRPEVFTPLQAFARHGTVGGGNAPRVRTGLRVDAIAAPAGRLVGVHATTADGRRAVVEAGVVVLAAGTLENTRLVGQLDPARARFDGLNDHLTQGFLVRVPRARLPPELHGGAFALIERSVEHQTNVFARLRPLDGGTSVLLDVWALGEQLPSEENHLGLVCGDPASGDARATLRVHPGLCRADQEVLAGGQQLLADAWRALSRRLGLPHRPLQFGAFLAADRPFHVARAAMAGADGDAPITYTWPLGAGDHEAGTLALGSVLDVDGRVPGLDAVFVAGPAIFPRSGAANPSLTTLALARRTSDRIARQFRGVARSRAGESAPSGSTLPPPLPAR